MAAAISSSLLPCSTAVCISASDICSVEPISIISGVKLSPSFEVIFLILLSSGADSVADYFFGLSTVLTIGFAIGASICMFSAFIPCSRSTAALSVPASSDSDYSTTAFASFSGAFLPSVVAVLSASWEIAWS